MGVAVGEVGVVSVVGVTFMTVIVNHGWWLESIETLDEIEVDVERGRV